MRTILYLLEFLVLACSIAAAGLIMFSIAIPAAASYAIPLVIAAVLFGAAIRGIETG